MKKFPPALRSIIAKRAIKSAKARHPYIFGAAGWTTVQGKKVKAYDCSGFVMVMLEPFVRLPHNTVQIRNFFKTRPDVGRVVADTPTNRAQLLPADLVLYAGDEGTFYAPGHIGMFVRRTFIRRKLRVAQATNTQKGTETIRIDQYEPPTELIFVGH